MAASKKPHSHSLDTSVSVDTSTSWTSCLQVHSHWWCLPSRDLERSRCSLRACCWCFPRLRHTAAFFRPNNPWSRQPPQYVMFSNGCSNEWHSRGNPRKWRIQRTWTKESFTVHRCPASVVGPQTIQWHWIGKSASSPVVNNINPESQSQPHAGISIAILPEAWLIYTTRN